MKNGNNSNFTLFDVIDNPEWSVANWTNIDSTATFTNDCEKFRSNKIHGTVVLDNNCIYEEIEKGLEGIIVKTEPDYFYAITDSNGAYTISVNPGTYKVEMVMPNRNGLPINPICPESNFHTVTFSDFYQDTTGINFHNEIIECHYLTVDVNSNRRRRCFQNHTYVNIAMKGMQMQTVLKYMFSFLNM